MLAVAVASTVAAAFMVAAVASTAVVEVSTVAVASTAVDFMVAVASMAAAEVSTVVVVAVSFQQNYECRMAVGSTLAAILLLGYLHRSNNAIQQHPLYCPCILPAIS